MKVHACQTVHALIVQSTFIIIFIAVVTYTCNSGFVLRGGNEMRTCVDAGDSEGFCESCVVSSACMSAQTFYSTYDLALHQSARYLLGPFTRGL